MNLQRYDLHTHSIVSDGSYTPKELIDAALALNITGISITDHDTVDAYTEELFLYAKEKTVILIPGVEFSSVFEDIEIHVLGYCFDIHNESLKQFCVRHKTRRKERNQQILALLKQEGMELSLDDLRDVGGVVGRPHIAQALVKKGYVGTIQEAFQKFIGDGKPCFLPGNRFSLEETLGIIHQAKGKAVLAHPIFLKKRSFIKRVLEHPFDGMECFYANFSEKQNNDMCRIAAEVPRKLIQTGGSDFHGTVKPYSSLGSAYTSQENLERLCTL